MLLRRKHVKNWNDGLSWLICNHFWWSHTTCEREEIVWKEKLASIFFHIQNKCWWTGNSLYCQCSHSDLFFVDECCRNWLSPKSQAFEELESFVFDKTILKDKVHLTQFSCTGVLEVYHSLLNKWAPKSTHFSYKGMVAQSQLAAIDFNQIQNLEQTGKNKTKKLYGPFLWMGFNCLRARATSSWQFTFYH